MQLNEYDNAAVQLASSALGQILKLHNDRESATPRPKTDLLYHYTTAEGLKGIVENDELWASSAYYLNDSSEIYYGCGLLRDVIDEWIKNSSRPETSLTLGLVRQLRSWFGENLLEKNVVPPVHVACFCEDDNLLSQWRAYGQTGGYSLGFRVPIADYLGSGFRPEPCVYTSKWAKIEYDRKAQAARCNAILDILNAFDDPAIEQAVKAVAGHPLVGHWKIAAAISDVLLEEMISFKNEAFAVEKEWRLVVRRREFVKQGTDDGGKAPTPVHFRPTRGLLIPYVKLLPTDPAKKLPLATIRSGPTLDKTSAGAALSVFLTKNGYRAVHVKGSDIPVRF